MRTYQGVARLGAHQSTTYTTAAAGTITTAFPLGVELPDQQRCRNAGIRVRPQAGKHGRVAVATVILRVRGRVRRINKMIYVLPVYGRVEWRELVRQIIAAHSLPHLPKGISHIETILT